MTRTWKALRAGMLSGRCIEKGEIVEMDDSAVTDRVKSLFECLTPDEVRAIEDAKEGDPDMKVMAARLKAAKIPMKRGMKKSEIKELFDRFLVEGATAKSVAEVME